MPLLRVLLLLFGALNVAWGLYALARPGPAARLMKLVPEAPAARGEIRAVYGGLVLALGALMIAAPWSPHGRGWLLAFSCAFAALAVGRVLSLLLDGLSPYTGAAAALEGLAAGFLLLAAARWESVRGGAA